VEKEQMTSSGQLSLTHGQGVVEFRIITSGAAESTYTSLCTHGGSRSYIA